MTKKEDNINYKISWINAGGICGSLGILFYFLAAFVPMPDFAGYVAAFAFGPLLCIGFIGLYHALATHKNSPVLQAGTLFAVAGGITLLLMLCVQQSIFATLKQLKTPDTDSLKIALSTGLNSVQAGLDVAWDVLIGTATILVSISMIQHPRFGKIIGISGILLGLLLLSFNIWFFPTPPGELGSVDWGPFVALWMIAIFILLLCARKWVHEKLIAEN